MTKDDKTTDPVEVKGDAIRYEILAHHEDGSTIAFLADEWGASPGTAVWGNAVRVTADDEDGELGTYFVLVSKCKFIEASDVDTMMFMLGTAPPPSSNNDEDTAEAPSELLLQ